jgi:hypothetical protein
MATRLGNLRLNYRGEWSSGSAYYQNDVVKHKSGYWVCVTDHSSTSTTPLSRTGVNSDNIGSPGTNWRLLSATMQGNRNTIGSTAMSGFVAGNATNSWWKSGTYYFGNIVLYRTTDHTLTTYRCKVTSTTAAPTNTSAWEVVAKGQGDPVHYVDPEADEPFCNRGYHVRSDWNGGTYWEGDSRGYAVTSWNADWNEYFRNAEGGITGVPSFYDTSGRWTVPWVGTTNNGHLTRVPWIPMDYLGGFLSNSDNSVPRPAMMLKSYRHWMVLMDDGSVHHSGYGGHGQQGIGESDTRAIGTLLRCGYANVNRSGTTTVLRGKKAIRIAMSVSTNDNNSSSMYALIDNGNGTNTLYSWGYNGYGQLGHGDTTERTVPTAVSWNASTNGKIVDVWSCGGQYAHTFILTSTGKMFSAGYDNIGQLGHGTGSASTFTLVKNWASYGGIRKFAFAGEQYMSAAVVTGNGQLWTWGEAARGQLGLSSTTDRTTPTRVGSFTDAQNVWMIGSNQDLTMFYTRGSSNTNNSLYASGENGNYQLGRGNTTDTGSGAPNTPLNSFGSAITNVIDVVNSGHSGNYVSTHIERYLGAADTNAHGYKTEWLLGGRRTNGAWVGEPNTTNVYNYYDYNTPSATTGTARYYYHRNGRYPTGLNPNRTAVVNFGRDDKESLLLWDRDTGAIYHTGGNSASWNFINGGVSNLGDNVEGTFGVLPTPLHFA